MKKFQNGFSVVEIVLAIAVTGLIGVCGWLVYDRQQNNTDNNELTSTSVAEQSNDDNEEVEVTELADTSKNFTYSVPTGWENVNQPYEGYKSGTGNYLISPDYEESGSGQLSIVSGAFIYFSELESDTTNTTTLEEALEMYKNDESGGYFDRDSLKITDVGDKRVIMYNAGHTTDGVSVEYINSDNKWIEVGFSVSTGEDSEYNAQDSPYYETFLTWLEEFVSQN